MEQKHSHSKIIDHLGGTAAVARIFDIAQPSVTKWRTEGIPKARLMYLEVVHPELFKPETKEAGHEPINAVS